MLQTASRRPHRLGLVCGARGLEGRFDSELDIRDLQLPFSFLELSDLAREAAGELLLELPVCEHRAAMAALETERVAGKRLPRGTLCEEWQDRFPEKRRHGARSDVRNLFADVGSESRRALEGSGARGERSEPLIGFLLTRLKSLSLC